jgi:hypothetical protein
VSSPDGVQGRHEVYTGSGGMSLHPVRATRVLALVCSKDYKRRERERAPKSLVAKWCVGE